MNATIFVTDDEPAIRSALVKRLSRRHHRVVAFESGEALLQALDHEVPDLMLLDVKMPGLSGLEALKACRAKAPFALVIMLTAYGTVQDAVEAMAHHLDRVETTLTDIVRPSRTDTPTEGRPET